MKTRIPKAVRQRDRLEQLRLLHNFEASLQKKVVKIIVSQGKTLAAAYEAHKHVSVKDLAGHRQVFLTTLKFHYRMVMNVFSERIHRSIKSSVFDQAIQQWILQQGLSTIDDIDSTTVDTVKSVIADGVENGLTTAQIVANITERTAQAMAEGRAWVIARTEMHAAANVASVLAAKDTGLELNKVWCAANDDRTREAHAEADGQSVAMDEPFDVDGEEVDQPGDGDAGNAINCRCTVIFEQVSDDEA
jgi:SPP1 gp7 family putative phage head morphogenesis protein